LSENTLHNVLVITYWSFNDALIQAYTLPYVREIKKLLPEKSVITLVTQEPDSKQIEELQEHDDPDFNVLAFPYTPFNVKTIFRLWKMIKTLNRFVQKNNINTLHCWCTTGGSIGYLIHRNTGKRLVIDSFEPHAESMVENGTWKRFGLAFKLLYWLERKQANAAEHLIGLTAEMRQYSIEKYRVNPKNYYVKPACVDLELFSNAKYPDIRDDLGIHKEDVVCVYAGKIGGIYLEDEIFEFWKICSSTFEHFKVIFLSNYDDSRFRKMIVKYNLGENVILKRLVPHEDVPLFMAQADFALNPVKPVPSKRYCTSIKDGEYWSMGLPIVISRDISDDSKLIADSQTGVVISDFSSGGLFEAAKSIKELISSGSNYQERSRELANNFRNIKNQIFIYEQIYIPGELKP